MQHNLAEDVSTRTLNSLLASLEIPVVLQCPLELTPSLILVIFESMFKTRLPISAVTRKCASYPARVEAMKIFIGVLEDDVLGIDVGLGDIDPRRLADGRQEEVLRVADIFCWLGKRMNYISQDGLSVGNIARSRVRITNGEDDFRPTSPSLLSAMSTSHDSSLLEHSTQSITDSQTTMSAHEAPDDESLDPVEDESFSVFAQSSPPGRDRREFVFSDHSHVSDVDEGPSMDVHRRRNPSRRYDFDSEDSDPEDPYCHCESDLSANSGEEPPIRTSGYLDTIDFEDELRRYELRRNKSEDMTFHKRHRHLIPHPADLQYQTPRSSSGIVTRHTSPTQYTLALLEERARLLAKLSKLRNNCD